MTHHEYSWRFTKGVSEGLVREARRQELIEEIASFGPAAVYAGLLHYAQAKSYKPGWAYYAFIEIFGTGPQPQDRGEPKALPNLLIEEWAAGRKRKPAAKRRAA